MVSCYFMLYHVVAIKSNLLIGLNNLVNDLDDLNDLKPDYRELQLIFPFSNLPLFSTNDLRPAPGNWTTGRRGDGTSHISSPFRKPQVLSSAKLCFTSPSGTMHMAAGTRSFR